MKRRKLPKPDQQIVSTEQGLAATIDFPSRWPVGGEIFLLTAPFIERWATLRDRSRRYRALCISRADADRASRAFRLKLRLPAGFWHAETSARHGA